MLGQQRRQTKVVQDGSPPARTGKSKTVDALSCLFQQMGRIGHSQYVKDAWIDCILDKYKYFAKKWTQKPRKPMQIPDPLINRKSGGLGRMLTLNVHLINEQLL